MDGDVDEFVAAGERLVDGVVDHLVDKVMQATRASRPDVSTGSQTDGLEALKDMMSFAVYTASAIKKPCK